MCLSYVELKRFLSSFLGLLFFFSIYSQNNVISNAEYQIKIYDSEGKVEITEMLNLNPVSNERPDEGTSTGAGTGTGTGGGAVDKTLTGNLYSVGSTTKLHINKGYTFKLFSNYSELSNANMGQNFEMDKWGVANPLSAVNSVENGKILSDFDCASINLFILKGPDGNIYYYLNFSTVAYTAVTAPVFAEIQSTTHTESPYQVPIYFRRNDAYGTVFSATFDTPKDIDIIWFGIPSDNSGKNFWWFETDELLGPDTWSREIIASETKGKGTKLDMSGRYYYRVGISSNKKESNTQNSYNGLKIRVDDYGPAINFVSYAENKFDKSQGSTIIIGTHFTYTLKDIETYTPESAIYFYDENGNQIYYLRGIFNADVNLSLTVPENVRKCRIESMYTLGTIKVYKYQTEMLDVVIDNRIENKVELVAANKMINSSVYGGVCTDLNLRVPSKYNGESPIYPYSEIKLYQYNKQKYGNIENAKTKQTLYKIETNKAITIDDTETYTQEDVIYQKVDLEDNSKNVKMGYCAESLYTFAYPKTVKYFSEIKAGDYKRSVSDKSWTVINNSIFTEIEETYNGEDVTTGVDKVNEDPLKYSVYGNIIQFTGNVNHIEVYSLSGTKVAESFNNQVEISTDGIYVVKVNDKVFKVVI